MQMYVKIKMPKTEDNQLINNFSVLRAWPIFYD